MQHFFKVGLAFAALTGAFSVYAADAVNKTDCDANSTDADCNHATTTTGENSGIKLPPAINGDPNSHVNAAGGLPERLRPQLFNPPATAPAPAPAK